MKKLGIMFVLGVLLAQPSYGSVTQTLDAIVVTASRFEQPNYEVPSNVSVITQEDIQATNAITLPDVLKEAIGVFSYDNSTLKTTKVDIRGFGDTSARNVLLLVNNRRVNDISVAGADFTQIPLDSIERIEIIRGAATVLYGDNAVGGVINVITKKGKGDISGKLGSTYGSYDKHGSDAEVSGSFKGFGYYAYGQYLKSNGYRDNSDELYRDAITRLNYDWEDKLGIDFEYGYHNDAYDLPGGLDEAELALLGRRGSADNNNVAHTRDEYYKLSFDASPWTNDEYLGDLLVDLHYRHRETFDSFSGFDTDRDNYTQGFAMRYVFDHYLFGRDTNFVTGIDYYDHENDITGSGSNSDDLTISKAELGVYGFLQQELIDHLYLTAGTRYHQADYTFNQRNVINYIERDADETVSMGGLKYEYDKGSSIHANVQQTFRFLATDEWYSSFSGLNTDLKQQTGVQYELGWRHNFSDFVLSTVTPYWIETKNEIYYDPNAGFFGSNDNYDETRRIGVEVGSQVDFLKVLEEASFLNKLDFFWNYTYQRPEFSEGANDGNDIPLVPRHQASAGITTCIFDHYEWSLMGRYVGERYIINDTLNQMPPAKPYYVLDTRFAYKIENLEVFLAVNNITDREYSPYQIKKTASTRDRFPAPERNFLIGMDVKF